MMPDMRLRIKELGIEDQVVLLGPLPPERVAMEMRHAHALRGELEQRDRRGREDDEGDEGLDKREPAIGARGPHDTSRRPVSQSMSISRSAAPLESTMRPPLVLPSS